MKKVFITGADRGIGFAMCQSFLNGGWQVFAGQYMTRWKELENLKKEWSSRLCLIPIDVSDRASVWEAVNLVREQTDTIDMLINCAGIIGGDKASDILQMYKVNTLGSVCVVESFLPVMKEGMKRLCFVSSEAGSISVAHRTGSYGYCMSRAALNMVVRLMFNRLRKEGYTFRLYHSGWVNSYMSGDEKSTGGIYEPEETAKAAYETFTEDRNWEEVLVMTDVRGEMWPF